MISHVDLIFDWGFCWCGVWQGATNDAGELFGGGEFACKRNKGVRSLNLIVAETKYLSRLHSHLFYKEGGTDLFTAYAWSFDNRSRITQQVNEDGTSDYTTELACVDS